MIKKLPFYYVYGNDTDLIEKKWLPDLKRKYPNAGFNWYDSSIEDVNVGSITTQFSSHNLFQDQTVFIFRGVDDRQEQYFELGSALKENYVGNNVLVFLAGGLNKTTKLGKFVSKDFIVQEFSLPEIKPFDMLDAINVKNSIQVLNQCRKLLDNDYHPLLLYSLIYNHLLLMKQVKDREGDSVDWIARDLRQHQFRIKKMVVANRYWHLQEIDTVLWNFTELGKLLRTWEYDENMLLQMYLLKMFI